MSTRTRDALGITIAASLLRSDPRTELIAPMLDQLCAVWDFLDEMAQRTNRHPKDPRSAAEYAVHEEMARLLATMYRAWPTHLYAETPIYRYPTC